MALWVFVYLGTTPIGSIVTGWIISAGGPRAALLVGSGACLAAAVLAAFVHTPANPDQASLILVSDNFVPAQVFVVKRPRTQLGSSATSPPVAQRGGQRGLLRQVGHSSKFSFVLLRNKPEMEVGRSLHQRVVDAFDSRGRLDRRDETMEKRTGSALGVISPKSRRCRLASTMTVPALDDCSGACSTRKCSPSTM